MILPVAPALAGVRGNQSGVVPNHSGVVPAEVNVAPGGRRRSRTNPVIVPGTPRHVPGTPVAREGRSFHVPGNPFGALSGRNRPEMRASRVFERITAVRALRHNRARNVDAIALPPTLGGATRFGAQPRGGPLHHRGQPGHAHVQPEGEPAKRLHFEIQPVRLDIFDGHPRHVSFRRQGLGGPPALLPTPRHL